MDLQKKTQNLSTDASTKTSLLELPPDILLELVTRLPNFEILSSLLFTHRIFNKLLKTYPSITTSIAVNMFPGGQKQLQCVSDLLDIIRNREFTKPPSPRKVISFELKDIPQLQLVRTTLDQAWAGYIKTNIDERKHSQFCNEGLKKLTLRVPDLIDDNDREFCLLMERCFLRVYCTALLWHYRPPMFRVSIRHLENSQYWQGHNYAGPWEEPSVRYRKGFKGLFANFFDSIPPGELQKMRACLAPPFTAEEIKISQIIPLNEHRSPWIYNTVMDIFSRDYYFSGPDGELTEETLSIRYLGGLPTSMN